MFENGGIGLARRSRKTWLTSCVTSLLLLVPAVGISAGFFGFEQYAEREPLTAEQRSELLSQMLGAAPKALSELEQAKVPEQRFYALPRAAIAAYNLGRYDEARQYATESAATAERYADNWNYGNAIHDGHMVLGLLALNDGDSARAVEELRLAGETPGSPQLGSFGPSMQLAKALLINNNAAPVLAYFEQCRRFWKMGGAWLDVWEDMVRNDRIPNFTLHAYR